MPVTITTKEIISVTLAMELNGQPYQGEIAPAISFQSSNIAVMGVKDDPTPNTLDLQVTGAGQTVLTIASDCTFADPQGGAIITRNKSKTIPVNISGTAPDWVVTFDI